MRSIIATIVTLWVCVVASAQTRYVQYYDSVTALRAATPNPVSTVAVIKYSSNLGDIDSGGAYYYNSASVAVDDGITVIAPNSGVGRWIRGNAPGGGSGTNNTPAWINVKGAPYNAAGDGVTDDTAAITNAINVQGVTGKRIYVPPGNYIIRDTTLNLTNSAMIVGEGIPTRWVGTDVTTRFTFYNTNKPAIQLKCSTNFNVDTVFIGNILLDGANSSGTADGVNMETPTSIAGVKHIKLENVTIRDFPRYQARLATNVFDVMFQHCTFENPNRTSGDDLFLNINPTQVTFDDCWFSQFSTNKWCVNGPAGDERFFGGTIAPMVDGTTGANGIYIENGAIHLFGTHIEGPSASASGNVGISYVGRSGGIVAPSHCANIGVGVRVGIGDSGAAENLVIMPGFFGANSKDVWVTSGGSRTNTFITYPGHTFSGSAPVITDDRAGGDGIFEVIRADRFPSFQIDSFGRFSLYQTKTSFQGPGLLNLGQTTNSIWSSANTPLISMANNSILSWYDNAGAKTDGMFIYGDSSDLLKFGVNNTTRFTLGSAYGDMNGDYRVINNHGLDSRDSVGTIETVLKIDNSNNLQLNTPTVGGDMVLNVRKGGQHFKLEYATNVTVLDIVSNSTTINGLVTANNGLLVTGGITNNAPAGQKATIDLFATNQTSFVRIQTPDQVTSYTNSFPGTNGVGYLHNSGDATGATPNTWDNDLRAASIVITNSITNQTLTASQAVFTDANKALTSNPISGTGGVQMTSGSTSTNQVIITPAVTYNLTSIPSAQSGSPATNWVVAFGGGTNTYEYMELTQTNNIFFQFSTNRAPVRTLAILLNAGANIRTNTLNASWKRLGSLTSPFNVTNGTKAILSLTCFGGGDSGGDETNVVAAVAYTLN